MVVADIPPIGLLVRQREERVGGMDKKLRQETADEQVAGQMGGCREDHWTRRLISSIQPWIDRDFLDMGYELTQSENSLDGSRLFSLAPKEIYSNGIGPMNLL